MSCFIRQTFGYVLHLDKLDKHSKICKKYLPYLSRLIRLSNLEQEANFFKLNIQTCPKTTMPNIFPL
jgi:hypothetical protein